jgi:hypothetical protein
MVQGYCIEEAMEWGLNYADPSNPIGVPKSLHEGRLTGKGIIGKKAITLDPHLFLLGTQAGGLKLKFP